MGYGIRAEVWGDYALFTRPELKVERYSYDVMTPGAARGILEAICWKPAIRYKIDRIYVLNPIRFTNIRRNEVSEKISADNVLNVMKKGKGALFINRSDLIQQRAATVLKDVRYIIEAHFEMTDRAGERDTPEKFYNMISRRLRQGQCYHHPCFGVREFPVNFRLYEEEIVSATCEDENRDLGLMLYDMDYSDSENITPTFFRAELKKGILDLSDCEVLM
jgi:CRISPR-associated protein Cas5d